jgi:hypothetical protein
VLHVLPALLVVGAFARSAHAQTPTRATLGWVRGLGAESCVGPIALGQRVERVVGPVLSGASDAQLAVEGRVERVGAAYVATVAVSNPAGERLGTREVQGEGDDCRAFDDLFAFVIAVMIDPDAALAALPGELAAVGDPGAELLASLAQQPAPQPAGFAREWSSPRSSRRRRTSLRVSDRTKRSRSTSAWPWGRAASWVRCPRRLRG